MILTVDCQCPQCGAALPLAEGQRFLVCEFCGAGNFLTNRDLPWLVMPENVKGDQTVFVPYLRCRGPLFTCADSRMAFRVIDASTCTADLPGIPFSLGIRPQAVKLTFPDPRSIGQRLASEGKTTAHLMTMITRGHGRRGKRQLHQALIGEVMSMVYLPLVIRGNEVRDGSSGSEMAVKPEDIDLPRETSPPWAPIFHAAICPGCGWDLNGDETSQVMFCPNCATAWTGGGDNFTRVEVEVMASENKAALFLPFWEVGFTLPDDHILTAAALEHFLLSPARGLKDDRRRPAVITPGFKIKPKDFLRLSVQLSHARPEAGADRALPDAIHPTSLAAAESVQAVRTILAARATVKKDFFPRLNGLKPVIHSLKLLLIPFTDRGYNLIQEEYDISINRQALRLGRLI